MSTENAQISTKKEIWGFFADADIFLA